MPVTDSEIRDAYIVYFRELQATMEASLKTASRLFPEGEERQEGWRRIRRMTEGIELDLGDHYRLAVRAAVERLEAEGVLEAVRQAWRTAVSRFVKGMDPKDWSPTEVEWRVAESPSRPWLVVFFDEAGTLVDWKVVTAATLPRSRPSFAAADLKVERGTTMADLKREIEQALYFVRTRSQRRLGREAGLGIPVYPHELVASLLPRRAEYLVYWAIPDERAREATERIFGLKGAVDLPKEIEEHHAYIKVPDFDHLESLLRHLVENRLIDERMLGHHLVQVGTQFWDPGRRRWVAVSEIVAAFDELQPPAER